jgi:hypothetical protein
MSNRSVALEVSVGRFAGLFQVPRLVGLDSGGRIRTRDLRVMSRPHLTAMWPFSRLFCKLAAVR